MVCVAGAWTPGAVMTSCSDPLDAGCHWSRTRLCTLVSPGAMTIAGSLMVVVPELSLRTQWYVTVPPVALSLTVPVAVTVLVEHLSEPF